MPAEERHHAYERMMQFNERLNAPGVWRASESLRDERDSFQRPEPSSSRSYFRRRKIPAPKADKLSKLVTVARLCPHRAHPNPSHVGGARLESRGDGPAMG